MPIGQLAAAASIERNVVNTTRGMLIPSTPSRYSMPNASIHGSLTTPCIPASPTLNCAACGTPNRAGTAIHSERAKTAAVVSKPIQRMNSSRPLGMIGNARMRATSAGRKTIAERGQRAGCVSEGIEDASKGIMSEGIGGMARIRRGVWWVLWCRVVLIWWRTCCLFFCFYAEKPERNRRLANTKIATVPITMNITY